MTDFKNLQYTLLLFLLDWPVVFPGLNFIQKLTVLLLVENLKFKSCRFETELCRKLLTIVLCLHLKRACTEKCWSPQSKWHSINNKKALVVANDIVLQKTPGQIKNVWSLQTIFIFLQKVNVIVIFFCFYLYLIRVSTVINVFSSVQNKHFLNFYSKQMAVVNILWKTVISIQWVATDRKCVQENKLMFKI